MAGFIWGNIIIFMVIVLAPSQLEGFKRYNYVRDFDPYFKKYSKRFFGAAFNWRYFKSQAIAESGLKPKVRSKVGAVGLMQIMPATYREITKKHPYIKGSREHPRWNIAAGIYYDRQLWQTWKAERPFKDRLAFTFASFNAGKRNIIKAQQIASQNGLNPNLWPSIVNTLPKVTGKRSGETIAYVKKINRVMEVLK